MIWLTIGMTAPNLDFGKDFSLWEGIEYEL